MKVSEKVRVGSVLDDNILYAVNNNSVSIIMNNSIRSNFDEFYCKVKDVMNAESRNFEVGFNSFIERVGGMI